MGDRLVEGSDSMGVSSRHILRQGPVLAALGRTAAMAARQRVVGDGEHAPVLPGRELHDDLPPRERGLIDAYVRQVGGDPRAYRGLVPPHLFPQWCFPLLTRTLEGVPYPLLGVVNGGCRVRVNGPMRDDEPIQVRAQLVSIEDDGRKALFHQRVVTGTAAQPDALEIDVYPIVVLARGDGDSGKRERARVPQDARELLRRRLGRDAGLSYAKLTGDFNPIHWVAPYARASGFRSVIMHGFGQLALAWEGLVRNPLGGDVGAIERFEARFTRPLPLPAEVGLYRRRAQLWLADAVGGPAYLEGSYAVRG